MSFVVFPPNSMQRLLSNALTQLSIVSVCTRMDRSMSSPSGCCMDAAVLLFRQRISKQRSNLLSFSFSFHGFQTIQS